MDLLRVPQEKKRRVIINTDAKNEVDDQYAIVQALLTDGFDLRGLIAAHLERPSHPIPCRTATMKFSCFWI